MKKLNPSFLPIEVLAKTEQWMAVAKPAGLAVHGGERTYHHLLSILREQEKEQDLQLVHRLDKETSGVILLARKKKYLEHLNALLNNASKEYAFICKGKFKKKIIVFESTLLINGKKKKASTKLNVVANFGEHSLLRCLLITGRNHQIRRHCSELGHPILGDDKYGDFNYNKKYQTKGKSPMYLHAYSLQLKIGKNTTTIKSPFFEEFNSFLKKYNVLVEKYFSWKK